MTLSFAQALLALAPQPKDGQSSAPPWVQLAPFVLLIVVFYFAFIRPQQKKAKDHDNLIKSIRTGDKIITTSGIVGVVVGLKEKSLSIRSADTKLEILKSAVSEITERAGEASESKS